MFGELGFSGEHETVHKFVHKPPVMPMQLPKNIVRRGNVIWLWARVPTDVRQAYGREFVREPIRHRAADEAVAIGLQRLSQVHAEWNAIRHRGKLTHNKRDELAAEFGDMQAAYEAHSREQVPGARLAQHAQAIVDSLTPEDVLRPGAVDWLPIAGTAESESDRREKLEAALQWSVSSGETGLVQVEADALIEREHLDVPKGSEPYLELCGALARAWIAALKDDRPRRIEQPLKSAPIVADPPPAVQDADDAVMRQFAMFERANPRGVKPATLAFMRPCVQHFADSLPKGLPASGITRKTVNVWHDLLRATPVKAAESTAFRGKTPAEVVELNSSLGKPVLSRKTINKYLTALSAFCKWLVARGVIESNPCTGLFDRIDKSTKPVRPFTPEELRALFSSPLYGGHAGIGKEHVPGSQRAIGWRRWLPLLARCTGARLGELAQLLVADVREERGIWIIHVTNEGDAAKSLKNRTSDRIIPVHRDLVSLGFLRFVQEQRDRGELRLFPDVEPDIRGQMSGNVSRWFNRYFQKIGLKGDKTLAFHSLRHSMADEFRRAGYMDVQFGFLLGHADQSTTMTRGYGSLREGDLALRVEMMNRLSFPEIQDLLRKMSD